MDVIQKNRTLITFEGIVFLLLGMAAIAFPVFFTFGVEQLLGWLLVIGGIAQGIRVFQMWGTAGNFASLVMGILSLIVGVMLLVYPLGGVLTLTILLTVFFFTEGVFKIAFSISYKEYINWGWLLLSGFLALIMAAIIWSGWPGTALWVLGLLVGINMIFFGASLLSLAFSARKTRGQS